MGGMCSRSKLGNGVCVGGWVGMCWVFAVLQQTPPELMTLAKQASKHVFGGL